MSKNIYLCQNCKEFTMKNECPKCHEKTINPKPGKFSVDDKYAEYRLKARGMIK